MGDVLGLGITHYPLLGGKDEEQDAERELEHGRAGRRAPVAIRARADLKGVLPRLHRFKRAGPEEREIVVESGGAAGCRRLRRDIGGERRKSESKAAHGRCPLVAP